MRPGITEFSYGYAITEEIIKNQRHFIVGAPIFPSLIQEGREGGYDLKLNRIGFPLFLQFKLSHKMVRNTAFELRYDGILETPFYRIHLMPIKYSKQHNMLLELDNGINEVYYVAPFFTQQDELNIYYTRNAIIQNSVFIKPQSIGTLPDDKEHHISIEQGSIIGFLFSKEPRKITELMTYESIEFNLSSKLLSQSVTLNLAIEKVINKMLEIINKHIKIKNQQQLMSFKEEKSRIELLMYLARFYFELEVILVTI